MVATDGEKANGQNQTSSEGPGHSFVPVKGIVMVGLFLIVATGACIITIAQMWPHPTPTGIRAEDKKPNPKAEKFDPGFLEARCGVFVPGYNRTNAAVNDCRRCEERAHALRSHFRMGDEQNDPECISIFVWDVVMWNERRLMLIVVLSGMLGGLLYANRSFFWYVGNRQMVRSWVPIYFFAPLTSGLLGLIIYLVIRGGFFSGVSTIGDTSPYAFAAVAVLVGMHHRETAEKLREIFEVVFTKAKAGKDDAKNPQPRIVEITSEQTPHLSRKTTSNLIITGEGFMDDSVVRFDDQPLGTVQHVSSTRLQVALKHTEISHLGDQVIVTVFNGEPGGGSSNRYPITAEPKNAKPQLTKAEPDLLLRTANTLLTLTGEGFFDGTLVYIDGTPLTGKITLVSGTQLTVVVQPEEVANAKDEITVTVVNGEPGGGTSKGLPLKMEQKT